MRSFILQAENSKSLNQGTYSVYICEVHPCKCKSQTLLQHRRANPKTGRASVELRASKMRIPRAESDLGRCQEQATRPRSGDESVIKITLYEAERRFALSQFRSSVKCTDSTIG